MFTTIDLWMRINRVNKENKYTLSLSDDAEERVWDVTSLIAVEIRTAIYI